MLLDQWCALICCGHSVLLSVPPSVVCYWHIPWIFISVTAALKCCLTLTVKQILLREKKNVQKDVSYFFGCGVDLFKCFKIMFVFSNKDFHTCNLSVLIIMYCIQLTCYCSRTISHVCSLVGQFHQAAYSKQSSSTKFLLTQKTLSLQISVPLNPSHHLR